MDRNCYETRHRYPGSKGGKAMHIIGMVFMGLTFAVLFALVFGLLVMWLWNWLMPVIFGSGVAEIEYWQAFGLVILSKLLFGGFGHRSHDRWRKDRRHYHDTNGSCYPPSSDRMHIRKWRHYRDFWRDEGKAAYDDYINRLEKEEGGEGGSDGDNRENGRDEDSGEK